MKTVLKQIGWLDVYLVDVAQDSDKWRAVVNTEMNWVP
jgi:hypothetical protein